MFIDKIRRKQNFANSVCDVTFVGYLHRASLAICCDLRRGYNQGGFKFHFKTARLRVRSTLQDQTKYTSMDLNQVNISFLDLVEQMRAELLTNLFVHLAPPYL